jgi:D-alanyl-D-alanine carboxypeptidase/D-alanyl-D-alanine-endopeptidase (penicillin-binding protein 4)
MPIKVGFRYASVLILLGLCAQMHAYADQIMSIPTAIEQAAKEAGIPLSAVSIEVKGPEGNILFALNPDVPRKTGSVMKLLTTFVALQALGHDFRFYTDLFADPDPLHRGRWNMALRGGGDTAFQYADLLKLLGQAKNQGVKQIHGAIVVDRLRFAYEKDLTAGIELAPNGVSGIVPDALSVGYSAIEVRLPADHQGDIKLDPPFRVSRPKLIKRIGRQDCPKDWEEGLSLIAADSVLGIKGKLELIGEWPRHCSEGVLHRAPLTPSEQLEWSLRLTASQIGLSNHVEVIEGVAPSYAKVSIRYPSPPLASLVRDINKYSNNVAARSLLLNLAAEKAYLPATAQDGAKLVQSWLKSHQLIFPELVIENGAGLSHKEVMSAAHLAEFLTLSSQEAEFPYFLDSLPIPGELGTLQNRFLMSTDRKHWHLKTGRLDGVRTLAGFHVGTTGALTTVVCMIEDNRANLALGIQEALLEWVRLKEIDTNSFSK